MPVDFEPRLSDQTHFYIPCEGNDCACPPSRITWFAPPCPDYITGQVTDARTKDTLSDVVLWVEGIESGSSWEVVTDALGRYKVGPLNSDGRFTMTMNAPGCSYRLFEDIELPEDGLLYNVDLVKAGHIHGRVLTTSGQPIADAIVYLKQQDSPCLGVGETSTDSEGIFCYCDVEVSNFDNINGSIYEIFVMHPEYSFILWSGYIGGRYNAADEVVAEGVMLERATIRGVVTEQGTTLSGAVVAVTEDSNGLLLDEYSSVTDAAGEYVLRVNAPATYVLSAQGEQTSVSYATVQVVPDLNVFQSFEVMPPGEISGLVLDASSEPMAGALVELVAQAEDAGTLVEPVFSDSDGTYVFPVVPPTVVGQNYIIRASLLDSDETSLFAERFDVTVASGTVNVFDLQG